MLIGLAAILIVLALIAVLLCWSCVKDKKGNKSVHHFLVRVLETGIMRTLFQSDFESKNDVDWSYFGRIFVDVPMTYWQWRRQD